MAVETDARRIGVRIGQRESHSRVIKVGRLPRNGRVAGLAGLRKPSRNVIRIRCTLEILQVTGHTSRGR